MSSTCVVCAKSANFTDGKNLYCGETCQITGNLTVLMSSSKWNRDVFSQLINRINIQYDRFRLIDSMLSDANERQRLAILRWMNELNIDPTLNICIDNNLISLLLYRYYSEQDLNNLRRVFIQYIHYNRLSLQTFKILLGKLIQGNIIDKNDILHYLVTATYKNRRDLVYHLYANYDFADWVKEIIDGHLKNIQFLAEHVRDPTVLTKYEMSGLLQNLRDATGVFNNPDKQIKL